jgi:hypothetical protein
VTRPCCVRGVDGILEELRLAGVGRGEERGVHVAEGRVRCVMNGSTSVFALLYQ